MLGKFGAISFAAVLISASLKRLIRDLKEIRGTDDSEEYYTEDEEKEYQRTCRGDEEDEEDKKLGAF